MNAEILDTIIRALSITPVLLIAVGVVLTRPIKIQHDTTGTGGQRHNRAVSKGR